MPKIVRREFMGNRLLVLLLCITVVLIPTAILYVIESTVSIEEEIEDPNAFLEAFRSGRLR